MDLDVDLAFTTTEIGGKNV